MANAYDIGDVVRCRVAFTVSDVATDPTTVTFEVARQGEAATTYTYGDDAQLVKASTGVYHVDMPATAAGRYLWRMTGTGAAAAAYHGEYVVRPNTF